MKARGEYLIDQFRHFAMEFSTNQRLLLMALNTDSVTAAETIV